MKKSKQITLLLEQIENLRASSKSSADAFRSAMEQNGAIIARLREITKERNVLINSPRSKDAKELIKRYKTKARLGMAGRLALIVGISLIASVALAYVFTLLT